MSNQKVIKMSSASNPQISLWVRYEPFHNGILPIPPHPRLSPHNIKKLVSYARSKGKYGYPNLSYAVWRHVACNKLQLSEDLAWMYFAGCDLVTKFFPEERCEWLKKYNEASKPEDKDKLKNQLSVGLLHFVIMLYIQQINKISLRSSLISGEEWPTQLRSSFDEGRSSPVGPKVHDEQSHRAFVVNNLTEILELLVEPNSYGVGGSLDQNLSVEAVAALGLLIDADVGSDSERERIPQPLQEVALLQQIQHQSGFSKLSGTFSLRNFQMWIKSHLTASPYGIENCIKKGRRLSWVLSDEKEAGKKKAKIATNAHLVPKGHVRGNKLIILSQVCKQTVARCSSTLEGASVKIHRCHDSYLYLLSSIRSVAIEKCRNTVIVLGAVQVDISLSRCEHVTVIATCNRISVSHSQLCNFHLITPSRPLVFSGNDSLIFAPYNTYYANLEEDMKASGMATQPNLWNQPFCVGPDHHDDMPPVWELLNPNEFYMFSTPFEMQGNTTAIPSDVIPHDYQKALSLAQKSLADWQKTVKESGLSREQKKQFQSLVEARFQVWLAETGHKRELDGIAQATKPPKTGAS